MLCVMITEWPEVCRITCLFLSNLRPDSSNKPSKTLCQQKKKSSEKDQEITIILYMTRLLYKRVHPVCVYCTLHCFNDTVNRQIACFNI